jgi:hypothetical protein
MKIILLFLFFVSWKLRCGGQRKQQQLTKCNREMKSRMARRELDKLKYVWRPHYHPPPRGKQ